MDIEMQSAWKIIPQFQSRNITATVAFYTNVLGFTLGGIHEEDGTPTFCSVFAGPKAATNIYFSKVADGASFEASRAMIALGTKQLDGVYKRLVDLGTVEIVETVDDKPWGYRQFGIRDGDGNKLTFFKFLEGGNPGPEEDDEGKEIEKSDG